MEPEGSLPQSQVSATCPLPESQQSSSWFPFKPLVDPFQYYAPIYA